jgi:outer membrane beta-barrel protein
MIRTRLTSLATLLLALGLLLPAAMAAPGDGAPPPMGDDDDDDDDDDDEDRRRPAPEPEPPSGDDPYDEDEEDSGGPTDEDEEDSGGPTDEDEEDSGGPTDDPDEDEEEAPPAEDEQSLDDRYRVTAPGEEDEEEAAEPEVEVPDQAKRRGIVKVIQKKFFLKYRRLEVTPHVGYIGNDNFIRRFAVGSSVGYHINDLLSVEATFSYLPNLKETDYKALTNQFKDGSEVVPDISKVIFLGVMNVALSPIYGKVEMGNLRIINYDLYFTAGIGVAYSEDDTEIIEQPECTGDEYEVNKNEEMCRYVKQWHFVSNAGGGLRVVFNEWIGVRLDARGYTHIEQVYREEGDIGLEMKQNFMISLGASFFFPPRTRAPQQ